MDKLLKLSSELKDKVVVDTNLLLDDSKILFKLATKYKYLILPITVLKELDKHKFKPNTSYSAREAIRAIIEFKNKYKDRICFDIEECAGTFNNDQLIIASAKRNSATLATKDMSMSIIAEAQDVDIKLYDEVPNGIFNPYIYIEQTKLFEYNVKEVFAFNKNYCNKDYYDTVKIFSSVSNKDLDIETWFFIFIDTNEKNPIIYANNPFEYTLTRIDNDPKYREMTIDQHTKMKMLDSYQTCALYIMLKAPNSLITGSFGTGKSLLSTAFSLANDEGKTFITRPNLTVDSRFKVGFLPGPQPLDAKILTPTGWSTMGEIRSGDLVIGQDGKSYKVIKTYDMGIKDVYEISTTNGGKTRACGDHVWATKTHNELKHNKNFQIRTTLEIKDSLINNNSGDKYNHTLPICDVVEYNTNVNLPISPYTMGVLLGDGSFSNSISFASIDSEIVDRVNNEISEEGIHLTKYGISYTFSEEHAFNKPAKPVVLKNTLTDEINTYESIGTASKSIGINKSTIYNRCITNKTVDGIVYSYGEKKRWKNKIKNSIYELGLEGTKSYTKFIPDVYKYSSIDDRIALLQGLMDTDGTVKKTTGEQAFTTVSSRLSDDMIELCRSLGINATYYIRDRVGSVNKKPDGITDIVAKHISYEISVPKSNKVDVFYLKRKLYRTNLPTRNRHIKIKNITYIGKEQVKCIKLDSEDSLYITNDFIVTHNTIEDKLSQWQAGIISSLYCLFSNTKSQKSNKFNGGDSYDFIRDSVFKQNFEMLSLESIQGISFMKNDLVLLDEAQLCSISILSTILSRFGKGSKLIITGDIAQTYGVISPAENGLLKLLRLLPNKYIAYVKLKINYRSELLELAAQLQNKIII